MATVFVIYITRESLAMRKGDLSFGELGTLKDAAISVRNSL
jgi:hypothetical protein